jgi:hypothetical protein
LAGFAPGKRPIVVYDELGRVEPQGNVFRLQDLPATGFRWEPRVAKLAFPFDDNPTLAARAAAPRYRSLREAFREAYAVLGPTGLPRELAKRQFLENSMSIPIPGLK